MVGAVASRGQVVYRGRMKRWQVFPQILLALVCAVLVEGCGSRESLGARSLTVLGAGVVNSPQNKSLRFDILKFGLERFCFEMLERGAPLRMGGHEPVLGRFFAQSCESQIIDDETRKSFVLKYSGRGYGWTNVTGRIGFQAQGLVEFAPDFQLHEGALYVYFRPRNVTATQFQTLMVESSLAQAGIALSGLNPNEAGRQIVDAQLKQGFTVIRYNDAGETDFGLGLIPKGERPLRPFLVQRSERLTLANDRTELQVGQQDFVSGFTVKGSGQALFLTLLVDGASAADVFVVPKGLGDLMVTAYLAGPGPAPLTAPPLMDETVGAGEPARRFVPVPPGTYYLIFDHTAGVGRTLPGPTAARVDYLVQVGPAP
jgi:hypothetical protein